MVRPHEAVAADDDAARGGYHQIRAHAFLEHVVLDPDVGKHPGGPQVVRSVPNQKWRKCCNARTDPRDGPTPEIHY